MLVEAVELQKFGFVFVDERLLLQLSLFTLKLLLEFFSFSS